MKKLLAPILCMLVAAAYLSAQDKSKVNYNESKIPPYTLEDPLIFADGSKVCNAADWQRRRSEILDIFQKEMYGRIPEAMPIYTETVEEGTTAAGFGIRKQVRMWFHEDKSGPYIDWLVIIPTQAKGPVPSIITLNYEGNHTVIADKEVLMPDAWLRNNDIITEHRPIEAMRGCYAGQNTDTVYPVATLLAKGYALVTACYGDISPDPNIETGMQDVIAYTDIFELWGKRDPKRDDNTSALGAWAWALSRGMDMIEADSAFDASKVVVSGFSRLGKAALLAGAYDERFAVVAPVQTGGGGAPLAKRNYGENVGTMTAAFTHWYCKAYRKYSNNEAAMPFDQHLLLSCVAPRSLLVAGFNKPWFDTKGEFLAIKAASPVWTMLGKDGMPNVDWPDNYSTEAIGGNLGYVRRDLQHGMAAIDWLWIMDFADSCFNKKPF